MTAPIIDLGFPHHWHATILSARPLILPRRHYTYPRVAEEVERGALEILVRPYRSGAPGPGSPWTGLRPWGGDLDSETWESTNARSASTEPDPFLATCALGFRDPLVPTGLWSSPKPEEICVASGGYAYLIDTTAPERLTMIPYRPVLEIRPLPDHNLLLFVGHHSILAWGRNGQVWQTGKLSDEGVSISSIDDRLLRGFGWNMITDQETQFALDLGTGLPF